MNAPVGIAVIVLVCFVLLAGCTSVPPMENMTAPEIAERYIQAQENMQDFSATVGVTTDYYPGTDLYSIREKAPHNFRIEYLAPGSEPNGTLVLSNGTVIWWYSPLTKTVSTTRHFDPLATYGTDRNFQEIVRELFRNYPHAYTLNGTDPHTNTRVVVFSALPQEPFAGLPNNYQNARVWIDAGSWMATRIEFYNGSWPSPMTVEYRDIRVNSGIPDNEFIFDPDHVPLPPQEFRHHNPVSYFMSLDEAHREMGGDLVIPGYLPKGYAYDSGNLLSDGALQFWLAGGTGWVSYIDSPVVGRPYDVPFDGIDSEISVNGTTGVFRQGKDRNQLQWIRGGHSYSLTGTPNMQEMVKMAESLVRVDDLIMKTLPWNKPKMAQPLGITELTSIIMPESWVQIHNTSETPGIIGIRLSDREFSRDFVNDTAYPDYRIYRSIAADERVMLYQIPVTMFQQENPDPAYVHINQPESVFRSYPNLTAVFQEQCKYYKIPCPTRSVTVHE